LLAEGAIGGVSFVRTFTYGNMDPEGIGNPPDSAPPAELDWDMWLGPAPSRPYNKNRFGIDPKAFSHFRWFWDYAGGMMTDWGVHVLDIVQMAFNEEMPRAITAIGQKNYLKDNRETPDTLQVTYDYPRFIATYENRSFNGNALAPYGNTAFHGTKGTLLCDRGGFRIIPERGPNPIEPMEVRVTGNGNNQHWANFMECVKSRQKPNSDIENCFRSTSTCLLGNISLRSKLRVDWDAATEKILQPEARKYFSREARKPWRIVV
ncbi:MAG: gfo/Idh/MocA family oxidoreductase, partial [Acidobacteria bacterium]|nr:gfo/Idh/MocA family oxidoreductase [Acidobacteriota bacterium]